MTFFNLDEMSSTFFSDSACCLNQSIIIVVVVLRLIIIFTRREDLILFKSIDYFGGTFDLLIIRSASIKWHLKHVCISYPLSNGA